MSPHAFIVARVAPGPDSWLMGWVVVPFPYVAAGVGLLCLALMLHFALRDRERR